MTNNQYILPFPKVVRIEPAGSCNLKCLHCPTGTIKMKRGIMTPETFSLVKKNIKANIDSIKVLVLYHGGEPLLNKSLPNMVREIKSLGVPFVKLVSNGMLLTKNKIPDIVSSGLDSIEFSLDGDSPEENNFVRRNCDYRQVIRNIKHLIQYKWKKKSELPKIFIASTQFLTKEHYYEDREPKIPDYLVGEFSGEYFDEIADFKCTYAMRWPYMDVLDNIFEVYKDTRNIETTNYCDHVTNTITVRWSGDVVACCYDLTSRYILGNIYQDDLSTIWNNERYLSLRQSIYNKNFIEMCANCNVVKPKAYLTLKKEVLTKFQREG